MFQVRSLTRSRAVSAMLAVLLSACLFAGLAIPQAAKAAPGDFTLYTPYTDISVTPGQSISYYVELINDTNVVQNAEISLDGPADWKKTMTSGGWNASQISVKPKSSQNLNLEIEVPQKVEQGVYRFTLNAKDKAALPLTIRVTQQGTFRTELTTEQPNMQGSSGSSFSFSTMLRNRTADKQQYSLTSEAPRGWLVVFNEGGKNVTSVQVDPGASKSVSVDVRPPENIPEGSYKIPIGAVSGGTNAKLELEVVIKGSYKVELTTPSGVLSSDVTAGSSRKLDLTVKNSGSSVLTDLEMSANTPAGWEVTFEPRRIQKLDPGATTQVQATLKSSNKAIAGDYVTVMNVRAPEASASAQFRMAVKTSVLWGWVGVLLIAGVIGGVYYLFRKYGRR